MQWFIATVGAALIWSFTGIIAKELMDQDSSIVYSFLYTVLALIFYTPVFLYFLPRTEISLELLTLGIFAVSGIGNIFGIMSYNYSIKLGELSRVIPFTKLNPVFTAIIAAVVLGEQMTLTRVTGIILVTVGSYAILEEKNTGWKQPFRTFIRERGPKVAALSALIYSFTAVADKYLTQIIQPEIYNFMIYLSMATGLTTYILATRRDVIPRIIPDFRQHLYKYLATGIGAAFGSYLIFYAFSQAPASRVIPALQIQVLISVIAGVVLFDEKNLREKMIGAIILIAGITLIAI